jgi:CBS domain-containing protein
LALRRAAEQEIEMNQTVSEIMTKNPVALSSGDAVREAARKMRDNDVGAVVVQDQGRLMGIVTDRDITVRCVAEGRDPDDVRLAEICTPQVATLAPTDQIGHAIALMKENAIRRIPVVENGTAVGIVSLGDLAIDRDPGSVLGQISSATANN